VNPQGFRWIRLSTRFAIYERDGFRCLVCGHQGSWQKQKGWSWKSMRPSALSLDHVVPKAWGGTNAPDNLVTLCVGCNSSRKDVAFVDWCPRIWARVQRALQTPIDRARGRALAAELDPAWVARERAA